MDTVLKTKLIASLQWRGFNLNFSDYISLLERIDLLILEDLKINEEFSSWKNFNKNWVKQSLEDFNWCAENNIKIIYLGHSDYPKSFLQLPNPPTILSYMGCPCWNLWPCISVVGSRKISSQSSSWLNVEFTQFIKNNCIISTSGGAVGADQVAHKASILNARPTIGFLPSGFKDIYPKNFKQLIPLILSCGGAVISQFPPGQTIYKANFHKRNKLIAAMSAVTFIVEASRRSGTLITAREALNQGKKICVLPNSPQNANALGALDLIYDGAQLVRDAKDLEVFCNLT